MSSRPGAIAGERRAACNIRPARPFSFWAWLFTIPLILSACGPRNFLNENDRLREENYDLREKVRTLSQRTAGLKNQLEAGKTATQAGQPLPEGVYRPDATSISIDQYSGGMDTDDDADDDALRLYLRTTDRRGRFVQTLARVRITVAAISPGEPAKTIATRTIEPRTFDRMYRSGFTGTHYTLTVPLAKNAVPPGTARLTVGIALGDLLTGNTLETEKTLPWSAASRPAESAPMPPPPGVPARSPDAADSPSNPSS